MVKLKALESWVFVATEEVHQLLKDLVVLWTHLVLFSLWDVAHGVNGSQHIIPGATDQVLLQIVPAFQTQPDFSVFPQLDAVDRIGAYLALNQVAIAPGNVINPGIRTTLPATRFLRTDMRRYCTRYCKHLFVFAPY